MSDAFSDDEEFEAAAAEFVSKKKTVSINWRCLQGNIIIRYNFASAYALASRH